MEFGRPGQNGVVVAPLVGRQFTSGSEIVHSLSTMDHAMEQSTRVEYVNRFVQVSSSFVTFYELSLLPNT